MSVFYSNFPIHGCHETHGTAGKALNLVAFILAQVCVGHLQLHLVLKLHRLPEPLYRLVGHFRVEFADHAAIARRKVACRFFEVE
jgi:hypothetical protein